MTLQEFQTKIPEIKRKVDSGSIKAVIVWDPQDPIGKTTAVKALKNADILTYEAYEVLVIKLEAPHD
jgi:hypothetical protein